MYTNFNRHDNFNKIELAFMGNVINFFVFNAEFGEFTNKLQGLYDGFLYDDLMELCEKYIKENEFDLREDGLYVEAHRRKHDLELVIEKIQSLPVISQAEAHSRL
jgi:hypothetical protein